jgi:hypothetical protein
MSIRSFVTPGAVDPEALASIDEAFDMALATVVTGPSATNFVVILT